MKQFLITVGGVLVGLILFLVIAPMMIIGSLAASAGKAPAAPSTMVLALDLREEMRDQRSKSPFAFAEAPALLEVISRLERAASDDRVRGVYVRAATAGMPASQAEELRAAIAAFRRSGKFVIAHLQNEDVRNSISGYSAIAGADEIWLQEASEFMPMGLAAEMTFFGDTLRRYHLQAQFVTREQYKSAADSLTQRALTPANREQTLGLLNGIYETLLANIAVDRKLTPAQVIAAVESTPFVAQRAVELKLVDQLGRPEDAERAALERAGAKDAQIVAFEDYHPAARRRGAVIAVVEGEGPIVTGRDEAELFGGEAMMRSDTISRALLDAADDEDVRAIIFRVSSPGGSITASDQILHALRTAKERGKKIVVSMGDVAASGGYYVSADADEIIAEPTTITGSIGVVGGKVIIGGAMEHYLSANTEALQVGSPVIGMFSAERPFSAAEHAAFEGFIDRGYREFLSIVAAGRGKSVEQVRAIAGGRVWTGAQAHERGLVDHLGGFSVAVERARALAEIKEGEPLQLRYFPAEQNPFEEFQRLFGVSTEAAEALVRISAVLGDPRVARALAASREAPLAARAEMAPIEVR